MGQPRTAAAGLAALPLPTSQFSTKALVLRCDVLLDPPPLGIPCARAESDQCRRREPGHGDAYWEYVASHLPPGALRVCEIDQRTPEEQVAAAIPYLRERGIL